MINKCLLPLLIAAFAISTNAQTGECGVQTGPLLPNLVAYASESKQGAFISTETFDAESCPVREGAIPVGTFKLLRFPAVIGNAGDADLNLGYPPDCPNLYVFDPCHGHYHVQFASVYFLWTITGYNNWVAGRDLSKPLSDSANQSLLDAAEATGQLVRSHKQGFCFNDVTRLSGTPAYTRNEYGVRVTTSHFRSCYDNQGLTVGYADVYNALLDGQWFVVDAIASGYYMLEIIADPNHVLPESNYLDNSSATRIRL